MKTKSLIMSLLLIASCATENEYVEGGNYDVGSLGVCPKVEVKKEDKAIIQKAGGVNLFKIEVVGYAGNCYYDERISKEKAVVTPKFKITRLSDTNVEDVHFSYYLETAVGPTRFLGKKTYFAQTHMIKGVNEMLYTASFGELSIQPEERDVDIYVGLNANADDSEYRVK